MDGNTDRTAGLESADPGGGANHQAGTGRSAISRALEAVQAAQESLHYCNRQESLTARLWLAQAEEILLSTGEG